MKVNLGYCCVSMLHKKLQCNRSSTKTYLEKHSKEFCHDYLIDKSIANIKDLMALLWRNHELEIMAFRIPEQILPQVDLGYYQIEEVSRQLREAGKVANQLNIQLSTHPSQYFVLNSLRVDVVERTIHSLSMIADTFACMELEKIPNLTLHLGVKNGYDTELAAINQFCANYKRLGEAARNYLVLENDHVSFTVDQCLKVHEQIGIPIVFDNKHYEWNPGCLSYDDAIRLATATWSGAYIEGKGRIPKLHLSSDRDQKKHAHSDYVQVDDYMKMVTSLEKTKIVECNIMLECKKKDEAVLKLRRELE